MELSVPQRAHERRPAVMATYDVRVNVRDQFGMEPGELADDFQFGLGAFPQSSFTVATVEKKPAKSGELGPTNIDVRRDFLVLFAGAKLSLKKVSCLVLRLP